MSTKALSGDDAAVCLMCHKLLAVGADPAHVIPPKPPNRCKVHWLWSRSPVDTLWSWHRQCRGAHTSLTLVQIKMVHAQSGVITMQWPQIAARHYGQCSARSRKPMVQHTATPYHALLWHT